MDLRFSNSTHNQFPRRCSLLFMFPAILSFLVATLACVSGPDPDPNCITLFLVHVENDRFDARLGVHADSDVIHLNPGQVVGYGGVAGSSSGYTIEVRMNKEAFKIFASNPEAFNIDLSEKSASLKTRAPESRPVNGGSRAWNPVALRSTIKVCQNKIAIDDKSKHTGWYLGMDKWRSAIEDVIAAVADHVKAGDDVPISIIVMTERIKNRLNEFPAKGARYSQTHPLAQGELWKDTATALRDLIGELLGMIPKE